MMLETESPPERPLDAIVPVEIQPAAASVPEFEVAEAAIAACESAVETDAAAPIDPPLQQVNPVIGWSQRRVREASRFELEPEVCTEAFDPVPEDGAVETSSPPTVPFIVPSSSVPIIESSPPEAHDDVAGSSDKAREEAPLESSAIIAPTIQSSPAQQHSGAREKATSAQPSHRTPQAMLLEDGPPAAAFAGCPHCHHPMAGGAIVCLNCGFNLMTGGIATEAIQHVIKRRPTRSTWTGPLLLGGSIATAAIAGGILLYGQDLGFMVFAAAFVIALPAWFLWSLIDARDTEGAQLKIWVVPGYIFAYVFNESRSRYLKGVTAGVIAVIVMFGVHVYEWNRQAQERERALHRDVGP